MKHRINKMAAIFIASIFALSGLGAAYAAWTDTITITGDVSTGTVEWELQGPLTNSDGPGVLDWNCFFDLDGGIFEQMDKDVGETIVAIIDSHTFSVTIDNAYPYYTSHVAFKVHGLGSIPIRIWKATFYDDSGALVGVIYTHDQYIYMDFDGNCENDFEIWWGDGFGVQLHECDKYDISFDMLLLQPALQDQTYHFTVELTAIQWNEYTGSP